MLCTPMFDGSDVKDDFFSKIAAILAYNLKVRSIKKESTL